MYFEKIDKDDSTLFIMSKGLYHDISDPGDGQSYYYASFIYNTNQMLLIKANSKTAEVVWTYAHDSVEGTVKY